ncbi:MAG: response regulator [Fimbriimonadaceae bacterium]
MSAMASGSTATKRKRVLVCDDERPIVRLIQINLERQGHTVTCAYNGVEAINKLSEQEFDLVLLDVVMPLLDGFEVLKWIRKQPAMAELAVIMLSVRDKDADVLEGYQQGADMYLTKPFNPAQLFSLL